MCTMKNFHLTLCALAAHAQHLSLCKFFTYSALSAIFRQFSEEKKVFFRVPRCASLLLFDAVMWMSLLSSVLATEHQ